MATDSRKRTLEALERRIAFAKAEVLQIEKKNKKNINENGEPRIPTDSTSKDHSPHLLHSSSVTPKKGNFTFSGHTNSQEIEDGPVYAQLSLPVNANLLTNSEFSTERRGSIDGILHELLQKGDAAQKYMQGSRNMKIDNWILLDNFVQGRVLSSGSQTRALQIHSKRSKKHMSMRQHKKCGSLYLPQEFQKFDIFKPMHEMWKDYIMLLLKSTGKNQLTQCLLGADLHGAFILVVECKITYFTGIHGIMIRETAKAFGIITEDDKFRVVPKKVLYLYSKLIAGKSLCMEINLVQERSDCDIGDDPSTVGNNILALFYRFLMRQNIHKPLCILKVLSYGMLIGLWQWRSWRLLKG